MFKAVGAKPSGVLANVQALRLYAAFIVVFVHLDVLMGAVGLPKFGEAGVDLFFVISGFIMVYTTHGRGVSAPKFMWNRILRIVPIYWLITLFVFAVAVVAPSLLQSTQADIVQLLKSLFFIPFMKANGLVTPVHFVGWTLNYEMFFYLLFAVGLTFKDPNRGLAATGLALVGLVGAGLIANPRGVWGRFYTDPIMLEFALGMVIALVMLKERAPASPASRGFLLAELVLAGAILVAGPLVFPWAPRLLIAGAPAAVMVLTAVELERSGWVFAGPRIVALGGATYSIYLIHPFVTQLHQLGFSRLQGGPVLAWAFIVSTLVGVMGIGLLTHYILERPLTTLLRRMTARKPGTGGQAASSGAGP